MTQSFSLPEPDSELAFNMMPPWKQSDVAFNLDVQLAGQKRRRDPFNHVHNELQNNNNNTMPNERVSNDSEACNNLFGGLDSDRRGFYSRILESSTSGIFPFRAPESNSTASVLLSRNFDFRNVHQRSLDSAEAATAQAMANFQALIDQGTRSSGFQAYNGSSHRTTPSFAQPNHGSSFSGFELPTPVQTSSAFDFFNSGGFQDTNASGFGDSTYRTNSSGFGDTTPVNGTYRTNSSGSLGFGDTTPVNGGYRTNSSVSLGFGDTATGVTGNHIGFQDTNSSQVSLGLGGTGANGFQDTSSSQVSLGLGGTGVNGFQDTNSSQVSLGLGGINAVSETWPNLTCQTSVRNTATSLFAEPQSPCIPRGQRTVLLSEAQEEYLQQMERLNSELNSPPHQSSRGRRLSYNEERSSTGNYNHTVFHPFSELDNNQQGENSKHLHVYFDESGIPLQHVDHVEENTTVEESATREAEELTSAQLEDSCFEPAAIAGSEKESNRNRLADQFDLNEVPVISVGEATPPKTRKKYHPRVAKDKRTYKRRVDGKKTPANPSDGFVNTDSPAKKAAKKRGDNQPTTQLYDEEGRDSSYPEVVDMDIEDCMVQTTTTNHLHTVTQHDTAVCDCEFCIKLRLERRNSTNNNNFTSSYNFDSEIPQSPVSPRTVFPDSSSNSRRNLFQAPEFSNEASARRLAFDDSIEEPAALPFDSSPGNDSLSLFDDSSPNAMVISQANATAYANVRSFFNARAQASCLQQFNESAAQLGFSWEGGKQPGAITTVAANSSCDWNPPAATEIVRNSSGCGSNSSTFMSRLCPRGILSPQKIAFRDMNAIQRVVYLKGILSSNAQLTMSPESLLRHVHEHLPDEEKPEFQSSLWPIILKPLTDEQMKQLEDYANAEQPPLPPQQQVVEVASTEKVRRKPGPKPKKAKDLMAMTLWPGLVTPKPAAKATRKYNKKKTNGAVEDSASPNHGLELVPYNNNQNSNNNENNENSNSNTALVAYESKSVVAYEGPFNPVRKRKPRPKVVLDSETVRVWKLLMGKTTSSASEENVSDAEKNELKWEDERRKMKAHALLFIDRMHIVQGDRSFSCWKGSVVDSVVGAFLTQNVNDVLSSSAFMSMRSRFPGRGFRKPPTQTENPNPESEESPSSESVEESPSSVPDNSPIVTTTTTLESSQESRNSDSTTTTTTTWNQNQSHESSAASEVINQLEDMNLVTVPQTESENSSGLEYQMELSSNETNKDLVTVENNGVLAEVLHEPSHGKYNPKTGLTGLERAKIEEKQVTARKSFDFSGLQEEFKPRIAGETTKRKAPPRTEMTEDGVDWEAVRAANVQEVADVIKERGLNWILAGRIKAFLERIHLDYGALDLEWLRSMSTDQTKEFLLSIRGLGLKSVECIRLLTLHHLAFPVDTNVGRICVRLGWVPLEPLPEELQLHLLELYPVQATIQKYLWPRLCKLDQQTLYELHYQMITFGKVFCTKSKPNCNACPMRPECKHFASALSSAKLALPAGERPNNGPTLTLPPGTEQEPPQDRGPEPPRPVSQYCQPIVEEPMTPESEADMEEFDMEDYPFTVEEVEPDDLADMNICIQAPTHNSDCCSISDNYVTIPEPLSEPLSETIMEDWGGLATSGNNSVQLGEESIKIVESVCEGILDLDPDVDNNNSNNNNPSEVLIHPNGAALSHEMVLVPHGASLPVPKLKNVGRLRTVHYVYELPDNHPLLDGLDPREHDDPCTYLLAIWSPGEVPELIPNMNDTVDEENPFAASSSEGEESIKATLLVPCRTAMQGSFPLNGTYFQVNEVFADHASSLQPMLVPRTLLWNLRRRFVFFGTSVTSIFRGMTVEEIQACFWRGYVCVRGFDRVTRAPKPLVGRLHLQAGKASGKGANAES